MDPDIVQPVELGIGDTNGAPLFEDGQPQGDPETPDFKARFEEAERKRIAAENLLAQQQEEARLAQSQQSVQQVEALWRQAEQQAWANAQEMDPDTSRAYMANFYNERDKFTRDRANQAIRQVSVKSWKDELKKRYELSDDEMPLLGNDPEQMELHAQHLKRTREEIRAVKEQQSVQHAANRGRDRLQSGAGVPLSGGRSNSGGSRGNVAYEPGTRAHLLALIEQGAI